MCLLLAADSAGCLVILQRNKPDLVLDGLEGQRLYGCATAVDEGGKYSRTEKAITERLLIGFVDSRFFNIVALYDPVRTYAAFKDWVLPRRALACNIERSLSQ